ncbi:14686_t:CDS:2 [Funneliformis caledonium]|uniref:DASH complex subunit DAD3 n=2 Tax=Funneliformis TaxID=1117308 RepID=A0A9N8VMB5_9GLOM|nr:8463_t:CDS:2 [Funneliformis mosseae]CAG8454955.1 14686_t:CDS:2 [Funneliformis caledonium]
MNIQQSTNVSPINLEKDILSEYEKLGSHIDKINVTITQMNTSDIVILVDKLRTLEKKIGLVYTLFKASVYSLITASDQENVNNIEESTNRPPIF